MRYKALAAILFLFLSTVLTASANGVAPKSKSDFGPSGLINVGSSATSGGATLQLVCQSSTGCSTPGDGDFLEVEFPFGLTPGELFDITEWIPPSPSGWIATRVLSDLAQTAPLVPHRPRA